MASAILYKDPTRTNSRIHTPSGEASKASISIPPRCFSQKRLRRFPERATRASRPPRTRDTQPSSHAQVRSRTGVAGRTRRRSRAPGCGGRGPPQLPGRYGPPLTPLSYFASRSGDANYVGAGIPAAWRDLLKSGCRRVGVRQIVRLG